MMVVEAGTIPATMYISATVRRNVAVGFSLPRNHSSRFPLTLPATITTPEKPTPRKRTRASRGLVSQV